MCWCTRRVVCMRSVANLTVLQAFATLWSKQDSPVTPTWTRIADVVEREQINILWDRSRAYLGVRPYSSVVEHPLSKRKVGSSNLPGGNRVAPSHNCALNDRPLLFMTHSEQNLLYRSQKRQPWTYIYRLLPYSTTSRDISLLYDFHVQFDGLA